MLAALREELPRGSGWAYEPKFDGFRCLLHRDGDAAYLRSRNGRDLSPFFSEVARAAVRELPAGCVVDGELVCPERRGVSFEGLLARLSRKRQREQAVACVWWHTTLWSSKRRTYVVGR